MVPVMTTFTHLLISVGKYVKSKQCHYFCWHHVLGWFSVWLDKHLQSYMSLVKSQLSCLLFPDSLLVLKDDLQSQASSLSPVSLLVLRRQTLVRSL